MSAGFLGEVRFWLLVCASVGASFLLHGFLPQRSDPVPPSGDQVPWIQAFPLPGMHNGAVEVHSSGAGELHYSLDVTGPLEPAGSNRLTLPLTTFEGRTERLVTFPTAMQWRRPLPGQPSAMVLRVAETNAQGRLGPVRSFTFPTIDHGRLPVLSLVMHPAALFDADTGIYVVGNAMLNGLVPEGPTYAESPRWFRYPGNFHGRGKEWERSGHVQMLLPGGEELFGSDVRVRINGQMTRAFPQHALRILFDDPVQVPLFTDGDGIGTSAFILRAAGNDQVKAFMRDALLQRLGAGGHLEVSRSTSVVLYVNGAYWGVHHLRQRMDEKELARRYDIPRKSVAIAEVVRGNLVSSPQSHAQDLKRLVSTARSWDGRSPGFLDSLERGMHVEAFLEYMALMLFVENLDWPTDNAAFWRCVGQDESGRDGRWYPIVQDLDLAFGAALGPDSDRISEVMTTASPIMDLFRAMMKDAALRSRFHARMSHMAEVRFASERVIAAIDSMAALLAPEMDRHTARWRKPTDKDAWEAEVEVLRDYAGRRPAHVQRVFAKPEFH
jgi:hypothetical protein